MSIFNRIFNSIKYRKKNNLKHEVMGYGLSRRSATRFTRGHKKNHVWYSARFYKKTR